MGLGGIISRKHSQRLAVGRHIVVRAVAPPVPLPGAFRVTPGTLTFACSAPASRIDVGVTTRGITAGFHLGAHVTPRARCVAIVAGALDAALVASRRAGRSVSSLHQVCNGRLKITSFLDDNQLAIVVGPGLDSQNGLVERHLFHDGCGALGLIEIAILEIGRIDSKIDDDSVRKLEQQGMDPKSAARSLFSRAEVVVHDPQELKGERRDEVW